VCGSTGARTPVEAHTFGTMDDGGSNYDARTTIATHTFQTNDAMTYDMKNAKTHISPQSKGGAFNG
jgi:hypothetical protein